MQEVPGGFDPALYASERVWIEAADGVKVPVSIAYRAIRSTATRRTLSMSMATDPTAMRCRWASSHAARSARSRIGTRVCTYSRRRRTRRHLARCRQDDGQAQHLHRLRRDRRAVHRARLRRPQARRHRGRKRRRPADGRGRQPRGPTFSASCSRMCPSST